jgi:hypothetical protein
MPASHAYPPYIEGIIFDAAGKPAAGGTVEAYVAGSSVPTPLWSTSEPAVSLGPVVTIDGAGRAAFRLREGYAYKLRAKDADGALIWERDNVKCPLDGGGVNIPNPMESTGDMIVGGVGGQPERLAPGVDGQALKMVNGVPTWTTDEKGMENPMTTKGDIIVGGASGAPARLGVGDDGDILAAALSGGSVSPKWEAGPKKYRNVYQNVPSPSIDDGYLGCLFYLSGYAQTLELPAAATIPAKSFIDFVFLDGTATLTITPQGGSVLNAQGSAVTIGGQAASFYRLTFLGRGDVGGVQTDQWALGGGLANGDHHVVVTGADASAGTLADKLVAGSNVTITPLTDGDGVQTLEIAATGGGGGGGGDFIVQSAGVANTYIQLRPSGSTKSVSWLRSIPLQNCKLKRVMFRYVNATYPPPLFEICIYEDVSYSSITLVERQKNLVLQNVGARHMLQWVDLSPIALGDKSYYIGILAGVADSDQTKDINLAVDLTATECISSVWSCPAIPAVSLASRVLQGNWGGMYLRGDYSTLPDSFNGTYTNKLWPLPWTAYVCGH